MRPLQVDCGFIRLTDSAVLIAALEMGFAAQERVDLVLHREGNWSSIRDKIALGAYPAAHMLAPMSVALSLGLGPLPVQVDTPFVLSVGGNTLAATRAVAAQLRDLGGLRGDPASLADALSLLSRSQALRIGIPFPQSMHLLLTRYFLTSAGIDPTRLIFTVAPPPVLPDVLASGEVDLVMVGEPWGSMAVERGDAEIILPSAAIWGAAPEKVLGLRRDWIDNHPQATRRLIRALRRAADWCAAPGAISTLVEILALPQYLDTPSDVLERALTGRLIASPDGGMIDHPGLLRLGGGDTNYPWRSAGMWIGDQAAQLWGIPPQTALRTGADGFRTDLYRQALAPLGVDMPATSLRTEGAEGGDDAANIFFDGGAFPFDV